MPSHTRETEGPGLNINKNEKLYLLNLPLQELVLEALAMIM